MDQVSKMAFIDQCCLQQSSHATSELVEEPKSKKLNLYLSLAKKKAPVTSYSVLLILVKIAKKYTVQTLLVLFIVS